MLQSCIRHPQESALLLRVTLLDNFHQQQHKANHGVKVPQKVISFTINYSYKLFTELSHPLALPLTAAEFVFLLQTATPT